MALGNFWIETEIDGRRTTDATGPRAKDGGFVTTVYVRNLGESVEALVIKGEMVEIDGMEQLLLSVQTKGRGAGMGGMFKRSSELFRR